MKFATLALLATVAYAQDEAPADDAAADADAPAAPECAEECAEDESCGIRSEGVDEMDEGTAAEPACVATVVCETKGETDPATGAWWSVTCGGAPEDMKDMDMMEGASKLVAAASAVLMLAYAM